MPGCLLRASMVAVVCVVTMGEVPGQAPDFYALGQGRLSCANWLSRPEYERDGQSWILGYWSAINLANPANHAVGSRSDGDGIVAEVKRICLAEPSANLYQAVDRVYLEFQQRGK